MGTYLNPGNSGFSEVLDSEYIDKTGMIDLINQRINTLDKLICISRPRRFGKSIAAKMLCAYYDHTCDSHELFDEFAVAKTKKYEKYLNKYNVIYLDIAGFISDVKRRHGNLRKVTDEITTAIRNELILDYSDLDNIIRLSDCLIAYVKKTKKKFVFIIDEWDAVIREAANDEETQTAYLNLLREWFKNGNYFTSCCDCIYYRYTSC